MALGDTQAGGGTGTGEWAQGAGADFGSGSGVGVSGGFAGGWSSGGAPSGAVNGAIDWNALYSRLPDMLSYPGMAGGSVAANGGPIGYDVGYAAPTGGLLAETLFEQSPAVQTQQAQAQVQGLLTDLAQFGPSVYAPEPSLAVGALPGNLTSMGLLGWDNPEDVDRSTANVNEKEARSVAGVAMAEARGQGGLGMQSVMNAGMNRAANDWGGNGRSVAGQMTAPGQFAAPYTGPIDDNTIDMGRQAVAGVLPDLTNGAQSFRADRPSALDGVHQSLEAKGSQSLYGHVFSDYPQAASIPTPPERPAEFGRSFSDMYYGSTQDPMEGAPGGGRFTDTFNPAAPEPAQAAAAPPGLLDSVVSDLSSRIDAARSTVSGIGAGIAGAFGTGWGPTNSIYDRVPEYTEPTDIKGPKESTGRAPSYREQPAPTLDQQVAAARADLAAQMGQRGRDVVAGGYSFGFTPERPSLQGITRDPIMDRAVTAAIGQPSPSYAQAPSPAQQSWLGGIIDAVTPSSAQAATVVDPYGFTGLSPATGKGMSEVLNNWGAQYANTPPSIASAAPMPANVPTPPERPASFDPVASGPSRSAVAAAPVSAGVPTPPERPAEFGRAPAASSGITLGDVAKYGLPIAGGLAGGPLGALAGAGLYAAGNWLSGLGGTAGTPGGPPVSDPYAYGGQGDYGAPQGLPMASAPAASAPVSTADVVAPAKRNVIHMPSRNAWLTL